jgi:hypothetical protein
MYPEFVEWLILSHQKIIKNEDLNVQAEIQQNQRLKMLTHKFLNPFFFCKSIIFFPILHFLHQVHTSNFP